MTLKKADLRHIRTSAYCCFLPDLTRFTASYCAGPKPEQAKLLKGISTHLIIWFLRRCVKYFEVSMAVAGSADFFIYTTRK